MDFPNQVTIYEIKQNYLFGQFCFFRRNIGFPYGFHTAGAGWKGGEGTNINTIFEFTERFFNAQFCFELQMVSKSVKAKRKIGKTIYTTQLAFPSIQLSI